jgi:PST family polysaccharide transporter
VIGFFIAVQWGIVAVAASFVLVGYLLSPVSVMAVRRLIHIEMRTYLRQFAPPLAASILMIGVIFGLKYLIPDPAINPYLELAIYVLSGGLTYVLVLGLTNRSLFREVLDLAKLVLPGSKLRKYPEDERSPSA